MASPVLFVVENAETTTEFVLEADDLPRELPSGLKLRKTTTRYAGTFTSVQVHGREFKPIVFEGVFDDTWIGIAGHALQQKETLEAIVSLGELVRLEYDSDQWWGTFEYETTEIRRDRIEYKITFQPEWREDPRFSLYIAFADPPNDLAEIVSSSTISNLEFFEEPPLGIDTAWVAELLLSIRAANNQIGKVLQYVDSVASFADLTAETYGLVVRGSFAAVQSLSSAERRLFNAGDSILEDSARAKLRGSRYVTEGSARVRRNLEDLIAMLRAFLASRQPVRTRIYTVVVGDTLQRLAQRFLGDFSRWTEIADTNDLATATLTPGQELKIPPR